MARPASVPAANVPSFCSAAILRLFHATAAASFGSSATLSHPGHLLGVFGKCFVVRAVAAVAEGEQSCLALARARPLEDHPLLSGWTADARWFMRSVPGRRYGCLADWRLAEIRSVAASAARCSARQCGIGLARHRIGLARHRLASLNAKRPQGAVARAEAIELGSAGTSLLFRAAAKDRGLPRSSCSAFARLVM